ncbi:MAG TPA: MFS transporter [Candidatus Kapabacteria bacterium]|nr:MFS transporter [Candidatus Kapabacteria bacterium]
MLDFPLRYTRKFSDTVRTTFRSIRHRNYRLFFFGQCISLIGTWLQNTALAWLVYDLTRDARALGIMSFLGAVPVLVFGAYAGTVADEYPKRRILMWTQSLLGVFAIALAIFIWQGITAIWVFGLINLLSGVVIAFDLPTRQAFVVEMVGQEDITNAVALNSAIFNAARLFGPALGALVISAVSIEMCFFLNGISFLAVIVGLWMMRLPKAERVTEKRSRSRIKAMREGAEYLYHIPNFRALMTLVITMTLFAWSYTVNLPVIAVEMLHGNSSTYGALLTANGLGALVAALTQAAFGHKFRARYLVYGSIIVFILSIALIPVFATMMPILFLLGFTGWSIITFFIVANTTIQKFVPDELRGRVMGIYSLAFAGLFPFGSLLAGYLAHNYNVGVALWVDATVLFIVAAATFNFVRKFPSLSEVAKNKGTRALSVEMVKEGVG